MSKGLKIALGIMGALAVIAVGAGFLVWNVKGAQWQAELRDTGTKEIAGAKQAGANATKEECVRLAVARLRQDSGFMGQVKVAIFTEHCLDAAKGELSLCAGTPPESEILKTVAWRMKASDALGLRDPENGVVKGIQKHCLK